MPKPRPVWIRDPVHGPIRLSEIERKIIDTPTFQRLRRIKQLGLANVAFPSADYSRFEHSLGVMHVVGEMIDALNRNSDEKIINETGRQQYRLAALLHDIGHYPFSHAMEHALSESHKESIVTRKGDAVSDEPKSAPLDHAEAGKKIVIHDEAISDALKKGDFEPDEIGRIFTRSQPDDFANLISSDLDADRLDYLARGSVHTGLPYGRADIEYLIENIAFVNGSICFSAKALRTTEHMLLARFFDYQATVYHRTVAGLELLLKLALDIWIRASGLDCSEDGIKDMICNGSWHQLDDVHVMNQLRGLQQESHDDMTKSMLHCLLNRIPPKEVAVVEKFSDSANNSAEEFENQVALIKNQVDSWAMKFGIPPEFWHVWSRAPEGLTKIGPGMAMKDALAIGDDERDRYEQSIRILSRDELSVTPIFELESSIMKVISSCSLSAIRVYVIPPIGKEDERGLFDRIRAAIKNEKPSLAQWQ